MSIQCISDNQFIHRCIPLASDFPKIIIRIKNDLQLHIILTFSYIPSSTKFAMNMNWNKISKISKISSIDVQRESRKLNRTKKNPEP